MSPGPQTAVFGAWLAAPADDIVNGLAGAAVVGPAVGEWTPVWYAEPARTLPGLLSLRCPAVVLAAHADGALALTGWDLGELVFEHVAGMAARGAPALDNPGAPLVLATLAGRPETTAALAGLLLTPGSCAADIAAALGLPEVLARVSYADLVAGLLPAGLAAADLRRPAGALR